MSQTERKYQRHVDEMILNATPQALKKMQEIDLRTQLSGNSFYDSVSDYDGDTRPPVSHTRTKKTAKDCHI